MTALVELCSLIRSKNAGPFTLTFDIMLGDQAAYDRVVGSGILTPDLFASLYGADAATVRVFEHPAALAVKASMPRPVIQGSAGDVDCYGGQQHALLLDVDVPERDDEDAA
ncbi:DUF4387 domain-containing protein [Isoptericola sp. NPDC057191]|uniref:DUF4387 domain-containing protein n=1 Tax=Isoptericola sp. NPDC057191 TaxID=3346041 RepID=UPI003640F368